MLIVFTELSARRWLDHGQQASIDVGLFDWIGAKNWFLLRGAAIGLNGAIVGFGVILFW